MRTTQGVEEGLEVIAIHFGAAEDDGAFHAVLADGPGAVLALQQLHRPGHHFCVEIVHIQVMERPFSLFFFHRTSVVSFHYRSR